MNLIYVFVLLALSSIANMDENNQKISFDCEYLPNGCKFEQTYQQFKQYPDEIFVCNDLDKGFVFDSKVFKTCKKNTDSFTKIYFRLSSESILDRSINLSSIDNFLNKMNKVSKTRYENEIKFRSVMGFDVNLQTSLDPSNGPLPLLIFLNSRFEFYYNNHLISSCGDFTNMNLTEPNSVFQLGTKTRQVSYKFENTRFQNSICPVFFNNIQTYKMYFICMIKTFYKSSFLKFSPNYKSTQINSLIKILYIEQAEKIDIDSNLLNEDVFRNISFLTITGEINSIEEGVFKPFIYLNQIFLDMSFFENLIHKGAKWISSINHNVHVDLSNQTQLKLNINRLVTICVQDSYSNMEAVEVLTVLVRDEDLCLFKDYPFDQMVLLLIYEFTKTLQNLSCTMVWLMKDYHLYYKNFNRLGEPNFWNKTYLNIYHDGNWTDMIEKCHFRNRLEKCKLSQRFEYKPKWSIYDTKEIVILLELMLIFIIPLVGLFGLLTNLFIVFVVSIGENKEYLKAKQYSYMRIVSLSNALVCLISTFTPMYQCQSFVGIFCSSIHDLVFTQYFRIICVEFISSVLKMLSNFSYLGFLITRSSLIGKDHSKFIQFFSELSIFKFMSVSLFLSLLFSIVKIFHYQVNTFDATLDYPSPYDRNYNNIFSPGFEVKSRLISIFIALSDLINHFLFIIFNLILDICLIVKLKATLSARINSTTINSSSSNNQDVLNRAITSVFSYTLFSIVFKVPASIKSVFDSASFNDDLKKVFASSQINYLYEIFCIYCRICPTFELLAYLLFIFSISCNIFFYFMFDNRFKIGFKIGYSKLFSSKKEHLEYLKNLEQTLKKGKKANRKKK